MKSYDPDEFIAEIESLNFKADPKQLKQLQRFLDSNIKSHIKHQFNKAALEEEWLFHLLSGFSEKLVA